MGKFILMLNYVMDIASTSGIFLNLIMIIVKLSTHKQAALNLNTVLSTDYN